MSQLTLDEQKMKNGDDNRLNVNAFIASSTTSLTSPVTLMRLLRQLTTRLLLLQGVHLQTKSRNRHRSTARALKTKTNTGQMSKRRYSQSTSTPPMLPNELPRIRHLMTSTIEKSNNKKNINTQVQMFPELPRTK